MGIPILYRIIFLFAIGLLVLQGCKTVGGGGETKNGDATGGDACSVWFSNGIVCKQKLTDPPPAESSSRFKVEVNKILILEHNSTNHLVYAQLELRLIPTIQSDLRAAKIFVGILSLHDASRISKDSKNTSSMQCSEVPSCIASQVFLRTNNPTILIGGQGSTGIPLYWSFEYPNTVKRLRLRWEFYQKEHDHGLRCELDGDRSYPKDGIPFVHAVNSKNEQIAAWCYGDIDVVDFAAPHLSQQGGLR